jgi:hypothetical protein
MSNHLYSSSDERDNDCSCKAGAKVIHEKHHRELLTCEIEGTRQKSGGDNDKKKGYYFLLLLLLVLTQE